MADIKFHIEGIVCTGCALDMENIMLDMDGIEDASVDYASGVFSISYDNNEIAANAIIKKVKNFGFTAKILPEKN